MFSICKARRARRKWKIIKQINKLLRNIFRIFVTSSTKTKNEKWNENKNGYKNHGNKPSFPHWILSHHCRIKTFSRDNTKCKRYPGENCSEMFTGCQYNLSCASSYVFLTWTDVLGRAFVISVLFSRENSWKWSRQMMTSNSGGGRARRSLPRRSPDHRC